MNFSDLSQISDPSENHALNENPSIPIEYNSQAICFEQSYSVEEEKEKTKTLNEMQSPDFVQSESKSKSEEEAPESDLPADVEDHYNFDDSLSTVEENSGIIYDATSHGLLNNSFSEPTDSLFDGILFD